MYRLIIRLLQRNSIRIGVFVICVQTLYVCVKITRKYAPKSGLIQNAAPDAYMYHYGHDMALQDRRVEPRKQNIIYEEDYDYLDAPKDGQRNLRGPSRDKERRLPDLAVPLPARARPLRLVPMIQNKPSPLPVQPARLATVTSCSLADRREQLTSYCEKNPEIDKRPERYKSSRYSGLLVDERHKVVFCDIVDVVAGVWSAFIARATGNVLSAEPPIRIRRYMTKIGLSYLDSYPEALRRRILNTYFAFLVVRHPMERLQTVWRQKFVDTPPTDNWRKRLGKQILREMRSQYSDVLSPDAIPDNETVGLGEFLQFSFVSRNMIDPSWFTYLEVCHPCEIRYDAIIRAETMDQELDVVLEHYPDVDQPRAKLDYKSLRGGRAALAGAQRRLDLYRNVSSRAIQAILKKYEHDMKMFGYSWDSNRTRTLCAIQTKSGGVCC